MVDTDRVIVTDGDKETDLNTMVNFFAKKGKMDQEEASRTTLNILGCTEEMLEKTGNFTGELMRELVDKYNIRELMIANCSFISNVGNGELDRFIKLSNGMGHKVSKSLIESIKRTMIKSFDKTVEENIELIEK